MLCCLLTGTFCSNGNMLEKYSSVISKDILVPKYKMTPVKPQWKDMKLELKGLCKYPILLTQSAYKEILRYGYIRIGF